MTDTEQMTTPESKFIKLYRNITSKGVEYYNWEIKAPTLDIDEVKKLNDRMIELYGSVENGQAN